MESSAQNASVINNITYEEILDFIKPKAQHCVIISLFFIVFFLGIGGNILVFLAVWKNKDLRTITNCLLVNLSTADFMVICVCLPPTLLHDAMESWFLGTAGCKIVTYVQKVSVLVSILTLTTIAIERYLAICHPLSHRISRRRIVVILVSVWSIALATATPDLFYMTVVPDDQIPSHINLLKSCRSSNFEAEKIQLMILFSVLFLLPLCIIAFVYIRICLCLWRSTLKGPASRGYSSGAISQQNRSRKKTAKMLIVVVVIFAACFIPVFLFNILRYVRVLVLTDHATVKSLAMSSHLLLYTSSAVNPIIYTLMNGKFRNEFVRFLPCISMCCLQRTAPDLLDVLNLRRRTEKRPTPS